VVGLLLPMQKYGKPVDVASFTVISLCRYVGNCIGGADGVKAIDINFR